VTSRLQDDALLIGASSAVGIRQARNSIMALDLSSITVLKTRPTVQPCGIAVGDVMLRIRQLRSADSHAIEQHLLGLAPMDRRARFLGNLADEAISAYVRRLNPYRAVLIGAFDPSERLVGLAEAHPTDVLGRVELAVSIDATFRHHGLGQRLVTRALALAFVHGAESAELNFISGNRLVIALVETLGGRFGPKLGYALIDRNATETQAT